MSFQPLQAHVGLCIADTWYFFLLSGAPLDLPNASLLAVSLLLGRLAVPCDVPMGTHHRVPGEHSQEPGQNSQFV